MNDGLSIDRLLILAGVSCSGKTTFIESFQKKQLSQIQSVLDVSDPFEWLLVHGKKIKELRGKHSKILLHYDLSKWLKLEDHLFGVLSYAIEAATRTQVITTFTQQEVLMDRVHMRMEQNCTKEVKKWFGLVKRRVVRPKAMMFKR